MTNVIVANLAKSRFFRCPPLYQYNYGMVLRIMGIDLPDAYQVDFANDINGSSITQVGNADGVSIPSQFFTPGQAIYCWLRVHPTQNSGITTATIVIPISPRATITDEEPTPEEQSAIDEAIAALNDAVDKAEDAVEHYPTITGGIWYVWDVDAGEYVSTGISATGPKGDTGDPWYENRRVTSLDNTQLAIGTIIEAIGTPVYVKNIAAYNEYGITQTGWYVFARINAKDGVSVTNNTTIAGAAGQIVTVGAAYVDVAVRFGTAAESQTIVVDWGESEETFVFKAGDLAVRNLDYRTTFYLYDLDEFVTWEYALTTDTAFVANKAYYTKDGDAYTAAEVTTGETIPTDTYYNHSKATFAGMTRNVTYKLDTMIDCPIEIVLPEVDDEGYGAWYEFQLRYFGSHSCTLLPPTGIKVGTVSTQAQTAGVNVIDLQYTSVSGVKMWSLLNTHSNIPA